MIDEGNLPSLALAQRLGFVRYGVQGEEEGTGSFCWSACNGHEKGRPVSRTAPFRVRRVGRT
jgi:RimJ/RimL family protein N-acetyltransferase